MRHAVIKETTYENPEVNECHIVNYDVHETIPSSLLIRHIFL